MMTLEGKRRLVIFLCATAVILAAGIALFSLFHQEVPELMTEAELLAYMKERYGIDFVICGVEDQGETENTLMGRIYWMYPEGNADMIITVSETIRIRPALFPTDPVYGRSIYDSYTGDLFTQRMSKFLDNRKINYKRESNSDLIVYLENDTFAQQISDICGFGNTLNEYAPFSTDAALYASAAIFFSGSHGEITCYPFQTEKPYISMNEDEIVASYIGDVFINYCIVFLDSNGIDYMKDANNKLIIYLDEENFYQQVKDICAFGEGLNAQSPFDTAVAAQAQATIVFGKDFKIDMDSDCNPFQAQEPYIVMDADNILRSLEE